MKKIINPWINKEGYDCFGCAPGNPIGLKMDFYADGEEVMGTWHPGQHYQGWIDVLHGGIQALMLDEVGSWWISYFRQTAAVTSRLDMKYLKPVSTRWEKVSVHASFVKDMRSFISLHMELRGPDGSVCASAEGVYYMYPKDKSESEFGFLECKTEDNLQDSQT